MGIIARNTAVASQLLLVLALGCKSETTVQSDDGDEGGSSGHRQTTAGRSSTSGAGGTLTSAGAAFVTGGVGAISGTPSGIGGNGNSGTSLGGAAGTTAAGTFGATPGTTGGSTVGGASTGTSSSGASGFTASLGGMASGGAITAGTAGSGANAGATAATSCTIASVVYSSGVVNPQNGCLNCQPGANPNAWSNVAVGTSCGTGKICSAGACQVGCAIGSVYYATDAANPSNACQSCQPSSSISTWSSVADGTTCGTGKACRSGACEDACVIGGRNYVNGAPNPNNPCQSCRPAQSTSMWSTVPTSKCVQSISTSNHHTCAVINGGAWCWGDNAYWGRLGNNTNTNSSVPVQVQGLTSGVQAVSAGSDHSCAIVSGAAWCWGYNAYGQLGNGSTTNTLVPVPVQGLNAGVQAIAAGGLHTCAIVNGGVRCWGRNGTAGRLGNASTTDSPVPVQTAGLTSGVTALSAGLAHTCAIVNGSAKCWGSSNSGSLGDGANLDRSTPVQVTGLTTGVQAIDAGYYHTCAVVSGSALCWGENSFGNLGFERSVASYAMTPTQVTGLTSGATSISAGGDSSCAVVSGGLRCWGNNYYGQLGNNTNTESAAPVQVTGQSSGVDSLAGGSSGHECAVSNGKGWCWGYNYYGQLGNNSTTDSRVPVQVQVP